MSKRNIDRHERTRLENWIRSYPLPEVRRLSKRSFTTIIRIAESMDG